ncbi:MAG: FeoA family protein [Acidimicrobiales bacterium]
MQLAEARLGATVVVETVADDPAGRRLAALGFVPGTRVVVGRRAPLGDPTVYRVRGADVAVRRDTARLVEVRPDDTAHDPASTTVTA